MVKDLIRNGNQKIIITIAISIILTLLTAWWVATKTALTEADKETREIAIEAKKKAEISCIEDEKQNLKIVQNEKTVNRIETAVDKIVQKVDQSNVALIIVSEKMTHLQYQIEGMEKQLKQHVVNWEDEKKAYR